MDFAADTAYYRDVIAREQEASELITCINTTIIIVAVVITGELKYSFKYFSFFFVRSLFLDPLQKPSMEWSK